MPYIPKIAIAGVQYDVKDAECRDNADGVRNLLQNTDTKNVFEINRLLAKRVYNIPGDILTPTTSNVGWKIDKDGRSVEDANYTIDKYSIPGDGYAMKLTLSKDDPDGGVFQFQTVSGVYDDSRQDVYRTGATHREAIDDIVIVPKDSIWLCVSRLNSNTSNVVQVIKENMNTRNPPSPPNDDWYTPEILPQDEYVEGETGQFLPWIGWRRTDYIDCTDYQGTRFEYRNYSNWDNFAYYDKDKNFLMTSRGWQNYVPYNACYFVASGALNTMLNFQLKKPTYYDRQKLNGIADDIEANTLLYGNYLNMDTIIDNRWMGSDGYTIAREEPEYFVSDYIRIPECYPNLKTRYAIGASLRSGTYGAFARQICFYDAGGFTLQLYNIGTDYEDGSCMIAVPEGAEFVRVCFRKTNEGRFTVTFQNNTNLPNYDLYQPRLHGRLLPGIYNSIHNTDASVSTLIRVGLDYYNNADVKYGWDHTLFDPECGSKYPPRIGKQWYEGVAYQIDCSSFVEACLKGIRFVNSRYLPENTYNICAENAFQWDACVDYDNTYADGYVTNAVYERIYANELADYAYKKGYLFRVEDDFSNVMPGDVLFEQQGEQWFLVKNFENIGHTSIVVDKYPVKYGGYELKVIEAVALNGGLTASGVYIHVKQPRSYGYSTHADWGPVWAARYPLPDCHYDCRCISESVAQKTVNYTATEASRNMLIQQIDLTEDLVTPGLYTLVFQAELDRNDVFFEYWVGTGNNSKYNVGTSGARVKYRPDGLHVVHLYLGMDMSINDPSRLSIYLKSDSENTRTGTVRLKGAKLYRGFVSGSVAEFD